MTAQTHEQERKQDDLDLAFESVKDLEPEDPQSIQGGALSISVQRGTFNPSGG